MRLIQRVRGKREKHVLRERFEKLPAWVRHSTAVIAITATLFSVAGIALLSTYASKAGRLDMAALDRMESGTAVLDREGEEIGRIMVEDRKLLRLDEVPQVLLDAVVATEDTRFFTHSGVDLRGIARSAMTNLKAMGVRQGASTITQQLTRHVYRLTGRTFDRKLTEIFAARRLEKSYTKEEILTYYLNNIYMGSGFYGMGSAAEGYFGKEAADLELHEAATLAGIIKAPSSSSPFVSPEDAIVFRNLSLRRMLDEGMIEEADYIRAAAAPLGALTEHKRASQPFFALQAVRGEVARKVSERIDLDEGRVHTTLDNRLVDASISAIQEHLHAREQATGEADSDADNSLEAAVVVIENKTGRILSAVGGRNYRENEFDYAFSGRRTPGTAFLPITYAAYFGGDRNHMRGYVMDAPIDNAKVMVGGVEGMLGEWGTLTDRFEGNSPASLALLQVKTGAAVRAGSDVGIASVKETARLFGITSAIREYPASFVGASKMKLIELARSYTMFANGGTLSPEPWLVSGIYSRDGRQVRLSGGLSGARLGTFDKETSELIRGIMVARMENPEMDSIMHRYGIGGKGLAGQHGSSHGAVDAWFIGFDRNVTCAVWVGRRDESPLGIRNPGYKLAMPIWAEIMRVATGGQPAGFERAYRSKDAICIRSGMLAAPACWKDEDNGLMPVASLPVEFRPADSCSLHGKEEIQPLRPKAVVASGDSGFVPEFVAPREPFLADGDPYAGGEREPSPDSGATQ